MFNIRRVATLGRSLMLPSPPLTTGSPTIGTPSLAVS